jgi:hypothetical protein
LAPSLLLKNRPHKIYQHLSLQDTPKFTQIWIFGLKMYHLATLEQRLFFEMRRRQGDQIGRIIGRLFTLGGFTEITEVAHIFVLFFSLV